MAQTHLTTSPAWPVWLPHHHPDNYTLVYCDKHKEGFIIKGHHETVPDGYRMSHSNECDKTAWLMSGMIHYDGKDEVKVIKSIRLTYNESETNSTADHEKCFRFLDYRTSFTDDIGEKIVLNTHSPLYEWFNTIDGE